MAHWNKPQVKGQIIMEIRIYLYLLAKHHMEKYVEAYLTVSSLNTWKSLW